MGPKNKKIVQIGDFSVCWNEEGIARSFEKNGWRVVRIDEHSFDSQKAFELIRQYKPDFVLLAKLKHPIEAERIKFYTAVRDLNIPIYSWTFDLYFGLRRGRRIHNDVIFRSDFVFSPDGGNEDLFKRARINHRVLRQGIFDEYCYKGDFEERYNYDIVFVGCNNPEWPYRTQVCKFLEKEYGDRFKWYGLGNTNEIRGHKLNNLYASAKIIIGDSVYSPHYWSNRIYETLGRGGFMIHPMIPGLENDYTPYKHFIPYQFNDLSGLKEKIDYFLKRPKKRDEIRNAARIHTQKFHTLKNRCEQLIKYVS